MKCYILHDSRTSTPYKEKSSKEHQKLKLLANFDVNLTSVLGAVMNKVFVLVVIA